MYLVWKCPFKEETISFVLVLYSVHLQHATPPPLGAVTLRCAQLFAVAPLFWAMPHPPVVWQAVCYAFPCHQYSTQQVNSPLRSDQSSSVCVCVYCSAHSASRWVSTCWCHQRSSTQEMWLQSLQQGRMWAKQERKYQSVKHVQIMLHEHSQSGVVTWLLYMSTGFNLTEILQVCSCLLLLGFAGKSGFILWIPEIKHS